MNSGTFTTDNSNTWGITTKPNVTISAPNQNQLIVDGSIQASSIRLASDEKLVVGHCAGCQEPIDPWTRRLGAFVHAEGEGGEFIQAEPICCMSCIGKDPLLLPRLRDHIRDKTGFEVYQDGNHIIHAHGQPPVKELRSAMNEAWGNLSVVMILSKED